MDSTKLLGDDTLINDVLLIPLLGMDRTEDLKKEKVIPCTLGELKEYSGAYVSLILDVMHNSEFMDDVSDDFVFEYDKLHHPLTCATSLETPTRSVPLKMEVIFEDEYIKTTVVTALQNFEYFFSLSGQLLRSLCTTLKSDITVTRTYQYNSRGRYMGFVSDNEVAFYIAYHSSRLRTPGVYCEQRIYKERWYAKFGQMCERNDIMPDEVEEAFEWGDYKNREAIRLSQGLGPGEFTLTHHRAMFQEKERFGHVYYTYLFREDRLYCVLSHRYQPAHREPTGERRIIREEHIPKCRYYEYDENGLVKRIAYGGGHFAEFHRVLCEETGRTLSLTRERYSIHFETKMTTATEVLLNNVGFETP